MNKIIDLRSDTFTLPSEGMRRAVFEARVGNAGYGEDPSVNQLEAELADYFGVQSAVFHPSGTMAGQIAIRVWTRPGDVVIIEQYGHNYYFETGSMAAISGVQARLIAGHRGILSAADIAAQIVHPENAFARTSLIVLENSTNFGGGTVYPESELKQIFELAALRKLAVHVDGARAWNVIVKTNCAPESLIAPGGSMSVCLSKGLGAPMGSILLGPADFIDESRRIQQLLGGVMRQVGFMATAGLYAFHNNLERLQEDHDNAQLIARELARNPAVDIDLDSVQTNIVYFRIKGAEENPSALLKQLKEHGILAMNVGPLLRLVTCLNVSRADCEFAAQTIDRLVTKMNAR